jgi:hypothetical protein
VTSFEVTVRKADGARIEVKLASDGGVVVAPATE